ncbi:MAG TPA: M20/M25/M40 family metallo-hydrolase, partial [Hyphomicrobiaceae bacterium]|nr:M20/M25/M40 family metallo-hydrolase [Hyphomicrobiaceae bacterium]
MSRSTRDEALSQALSYFDDHQGGYLADLAALVAVPTESQNPERQGDLRRYLDREMTPRFGRLGYTCRIYDNPKGGAGPVLLATRIEDPALPTIIGYGHGDVVLGMAGRWAEGRDPWRVTLDGERAYGRGVVDNKGQHLAHIAAIGAVIATRGRLGFNSKFLIEMGEETGSPGLDQIVAANKADFAADGFFASDGPRTEISHPNITLGNRGAATFELKVRLRDGGHHSGNWGGLLANPGTILAHALASIADRRGRILVEAWRPLIPDGVREVL